MTLTFSGRHRIALQEEEGIGFSAVPSEAAREPIMEAVEGMIGQQRAPRRRCRTLDVVTNPRFEAFALLSEDCHHVPSHAIHSTRGSRRRSNAGLCDLQCKQLLFAANAGSRLTSSEA